MNTYKKRNIELKKHVSTIHCSNVLSLLQRKIANGLLYHAYDDLLIKEEHHISIKELCTLIGYDSHDYQSIKRALVDLLSTVIEWNIIEEGLPERETQWNASAIIADASIKGSHCTYSYSNRMRQLLYMPTVYGRINLSIQARFKSSYGLALYENVIRYQNLQQTPWFELAVFRKLMGVLPGKYAIFRDFKRRVLDKAMEEVNRLTRLVVYVDIKRQQRSVVALRFLIDHVPQSAAVASELPASYGERGDGTLSRRLNKDFGLNSQQISKITRDYAASYIREKLEMIEMSGSYRTGKIINLARYLIHALADDYRLPHSSQQKIQQRAQQQMEDKKQQQIVDKKQQQLKKGYQEYRQCFLSTTLSSLSETHQKTIQIAFMQHIDRVDILKRLFQKEGFNHTMVAMEYRKFVRQNYAELFIEQLSFTNFCKTTCDALLSGNQHNEGIKNTPGIEKKMLPVRGKFQQNFQEKNSDTNAFNDHQ